MVRGWLVKKSQPWPAVSISMLLITSISLRSSYNYNGDKVSSTALNYYYLPLGREEKKKKKK